MLAIKSRVVIRSLIISVALVIAMTAKESKYWVEEVEQPKVGNFALPISQQPGPLISFGQNFVNQGDFLAFLYPDQLKGKHKSFVEVIPSILYGITNKLSLFVEFPIELKLEYGNQKSRDFSDLIVQLEQVVYVGESVGTVNDISIVGNITFPTGTISKDPHTGFGSPTFFLGATLSRFHTDSYYFASFGGRITTFHKHNKFGNSFLYQAGIGRNIAYKADAWTLNWLVEFDGVYTQRSILSNAIDYNSGGNIILIGPSLFFSTQHFLAQAGISAVAAQHLFGDQLRDDYFAAAFVGWKF